jgi:hypothetical protein
MARIVRTGGEIVLEDDLRLCVWASALSIASPR